MKKSITILILLLVSVLVKTSISRYLSLSFGIPDITLIMLVFFSINYGSVTGQLSGFASGLMEDFISLSPLGFNSLIRMVTGHLAGMFNGRLIIDPILFPVLIVTIATIFKALLSSLILNIFSIDYSGSIFISSSFGFELLINALLSPVLFLFLGLLMDKILQERKTL